MLLVFVIGLLTFLICWDYLHKWKRIRVFEASKLSGPIALPILGSGLEAVSLKAENLLQFIESCHQKYGKTFRMWILNEAQVYTKDVRHFESILSSTTLLQKGDHYDKVRSWLVDGLLLSVGKKWHARRKVFTPAFHFKALEHYVRVFDEQSAIMVQKLQQYADGKTTFDLFPIVCLAALDVITEAAMGVKVSAQSDAEFPYIKALKSVVYTQASRMIKFNQRYDWTFQLTAPSEYKRMWQGIETMHAFTIKVIEERRAALEKSKADGTYKPLNPANEDIGSKEQMALLDILLQSTIDGKPLSNEDIREEVDTFMFEGDDTTTSGVSHALYCIARHPEVQQKLYQEIQEIIGPNKDTPIDITQLSELKYMECVIKETLRLHPSVPGIGRKTTHDLKLDDIVIPANTSIYLMFYWAHRDPAVFPDPEAFIPERFDSTSEENLKRNPFAYVPFSAGPRNCIGQKFAMLEMKTMISKVLRCYELLPLGPTVEPMMNFILRSPHGVCIGLRPRVAA